MKRLIPYLSVSLFIHLAFIAPFYLIRQSQDPSLPGDGQATVYGEGGIISVDIIGNSATGQGEKSSPARTARTNSILSRPIPSPSSSQFSGSGTQTGKGQAGGLQSGSGGNSILGQIRLRIERAKRYPLLAQKSELEGTAHVKFHINDQGQPESIALTSSSGSPILDEEALTTIRRAAPFPLYPETLEIGIRYNLDN